jgi:hypothetical protein
MTHQEILNRLLIGKEIRIFPNDEKGTVTGFVARCDMREGVLHLLIVKHSGAVNVPTLCDMSQIAFFELTGQEL